MRGWMWKTYPLTVIWVTGFALALLAGRISKHLALVAFATFGEKFAGGAVLVLVTIGIACIAGFLGGALLDTVWRGRAHRIALVLGLLVGWLAFAMRAFWLVEPIYGCTLVWLICVGAGLYVGLRDGYLNGSRRGRHLERWTFPIKIR